MLKPPASGDLACGGRGGGGVAVRALDISGPPALPLSYRDPIEKQKNMITFYRLLKTIKPYLSGKAPCQWEGNVKTLNPEP